MFTHLISLKKSPWYIYAQSEEDAISICGKYASEVVGVVCAPEGLIMQEVHTQVSLRTPDIKLLDKIVENENHKIAKELLGVKDESIFQENTKLLHKDTSTSRVRGKRTNTKPTNKKG